MQELKLVNPEEEDTKFLFLLELLNIFVIRLSIKRVFFYYSINKELSSTPLLNCLSVHRKGLNSIEPILERFRKTMAEGEIYEVAPFFSHLSMVLAHVYRDACRIKGEHVVKGILRDSFGLVRRTHDQLPDLMGYLPQDAIGRSSSYEFSSAFSISLVNNILDYLVYIIRKRARPQDLREVSEKTQSKEEAVEKIRALYLELLGPLGINQLHRLEGINLESTTQQVDFFCNMHILNGEEAEEFKSRLTNIFRVPLEAEK